MIGRIVFSIVLLAIGASLPARAQEILGAWRESSPTWMKPPAELQSEQRYAEAAVLYFGSDHAFVLVYGTVIQSFQSEALSVGDGRVVYLGKWSQEGAALRLEYRLVYRTVRMDGETLPGPVKKEQAIFRKGYILFGKKRFRRVPSLDSDLQVEAKAAQAGYP